MSQNLSKFGWINQKYVITLKSNLHLNQSICKYYAEKVDLNMNPASFARLCVNGADARFCLLTLYTQRVWRSRCFQRLLSQSGHKYMNDISKTDLRVTSQAFYHLIWVKLALYPGAREQGVLRVLQHPLFVSVGNCKLLWIKKNIG